MRIEPKAFLAIEQSMAGAMKVQWDRLARDVVEKLHKALDAGKYAEAQEIANRLTLAGVVSAVRKRLEELSVSALLFGAHRVAGDVHKTVYAQGEPVPAALHHGLNQLEHAVEHDAAEYVRKAVHALIEEIKRADERAHMQKHDVYTEADKRPDAQTAEEVTPEPDETPEETRQREKDLGQAKDGDLSGAGFRHEEIRLRKAEKSLAERINDAVVNGGKVSADLGASLTTSRLITLGFLSQASKQGVIRYRVDEVLDDRTCRVCAMMHGKVFNVAEQMDRVVQALSTADPQALKTLMPWPSQSAENVEKLAGMRNTDLQAAGYGAPPYHAGCRGMLSEIGEEAQGFTPQQMDLAQEIIDGTLGEAQGTPKPTPAADEWSDADKEALGWERFDVTDPEAFSAVDDAYQAGDYVLAQQLLGVWKSKVSRN